MANVHRIEGSGKSRDVETLTGMRTALSWSDIDRDIAPQPKVKLPDRRFLNLWNSYDLSQFKAAEEDWQDWEAQKDEVTKRQLETRAVARDTDTNTVDLGFVAEALSASEQRDRVLRQNQQNLDQVDAQQREAMHQESMQGLAQLARAQHAADERQRMSDEVLSRHVDMGDANKDRLVAAQQAAGVPYTNVTHNTTNNYDQSTHNN